MRKTILAALMLLLPVFADAQVFINPGGGGGSVGSGTALGSCTSSILYATSGSVLGCDPAAVVNGSVSTAGRSILTIKDTITGSSATSNFLNITGTFPATLTAETDAFLLAVTADDDTQAQSAAKITIAGTGSLQQLTGLWSIVTGTGGGNAGSAAGLFANNTTTSSAGTTLPNGLVGQGPAANAVNNSSVGVQGYVDGANNTSLKAIGVRGFSTANNAIALAQSIGVVGQADNTATIGIGGWFGPGVQANADVWSNTGGFPTFTGTSALVADNVSTTWNIFEARDNGATVSTTAAYAGFTILDGAQARLGNEVLTSATMTPTIVAEARQVTHSYAWTNAMVVALGAALTGDITVATLPAKTRIEQALLVIDTAAGGPTTLTVSCGDAIAGTPFINYIVPSDAKAAANTVYGDLISGAETGTSLFDATSKWRQNYIPSYTATTLVTCHFIATVTNLNTTTTSTGRLILTTTLLP